MKELVRHDEIRQEHEQMAGATRTRTSNFAYSKLLANFQHDYLVGLGEYNPKRNQVFKEGSRATSCRCWFGFY